ncbi:MAG: hypothetical protein NVS3B12_23660 [Acidimicrobiales bacterium]
MRRRVSVLIPWALVPALALTSLTFPAEARTRSAATPAGLPDGVPPAALRAEPALPVPEGWPYPDAFPRTSGATRLASGALEYSGFLYGDHGAAGLPVQSPVAGLAPTVGTYAYPTGMALENGANIFRASVAPSKAGSLLRVDWNTLADKNVPIAEFGIDTGHGSTTRMWPAGAGVSSDGLSSTVLVSAKGAWLIDPATGQKTPLPAPVVDMDARTFLVTVPASLLDPTGTWKVRLVAGLANAAGDGFAPVTPDRGAAPGQPAVYDVGFRTYRQEPEANNYWMERTQATALAKGDVTPFVASVDWAALRAGRTTPEPVPTGYTNRWFVSSQDFGQGVRRSSGSSSPDPVFLGRVQPYAVYVPMTYDPSKATKLTWILHSLSVQHNQYGSLNPNFVQQACEQRHSICATTLGRGPGGWYFDAAELDFWEVWNRLAASYRLDTEHTVISGYSMGGWATYKLGLSHPDLFAKAVVLEGPVICGLRPAPGAPGAAMPGRCTTDGDSIPMIDSARNLPYLISQGAIDELVPVDGVLPDVAKFDSLGYRYRFELYPAADHLAYPVLDHFAEQAAQMNGPARVQNPGHVTYSWYPNLDRADYGIGSTGAYWVRNTKGRDVAPGSVSRVDAVSLARPEKITTAKTTGVLIPGDPFPAVVTEQTWKTGTPPPAQQVINLDLRNVGSLTLDLVRAGITGHAVINVVSDGQTTLVLSGGVLSGVVLAGRLHSSRVSVDRHRRSLTHNAITIPAGTHQLTIG